MAAQRIPDLWKSLPLLPIRRPVIYRCEGGWYCFMPALTILFEFFPMPEGHPGIAKTAIQDIGTMNDRSITPAIVARRVKRSINAAMFETELCRLIFHHRAVYFLSETHPKSRLAHPTRYWVPRSNENLDSKPVALGIQFGR